MDLSTHMIGIEVASDTLLCQLNKWMWLQAIANETTVPRNRLSMAQHHGNIDGKPFYLSHRQHDLLQQGILRMGLRMMMWRMDAGQDNATMLTEWGKVIRLPYIFMERMGKNRTWMLNHISNKANTCYNNFTEDEMQAANIEIQNIAMYLIRAKIKYVERSNIADQQENRRKT